MKSIRKVVLSLTVVSVIIYVLQIMIFHDSQTTAFYIFQDLAFLPLSIAIATVVVGEIYSRKEKADRLERTKMITSTFFTNVGARLMMQMLSAAQNQQLVRQIMFADATSETDYQELCNRIHGEQIKLDMSADLYDGVRTVLEEQSTALLILGNNPVLLEHESFTDMLWGLYHLRDEFRLRGSYENLSQTDRDHLEEDFERVFKLMLINRESNVHFLAETFPNYYNAARKQFIKKENSL